MQLRTVPFHLQQFRAHIITIMMCALAMLAVPVTAEEGWLEAGVIIDYGDDRITWLWIPFPESGTLLIDLLADTDLEMVTVSFGGLGEGVCQIDDTGCPAADCRQRLCQTSSSSPFWRLLKWNDNEWVFTSTGVSGARVMDGDIYVLSWSAETPDLLSVSMDELAVNAGADRTAAAPVAARRTDGESSKQDAPADSWTPALAAFGLVVVAGGVLVIRARGSRRVTP